MSNYCWHTINNNNCQTCKPSCQRPCYNPCCKPMPPYNPQIQNLYRMLNQLSSQVVALQKQNNVLQTQNQAVKTQLDAFIAAVNAVTPALDNASTATAPTVESLQQAIYNAIVALNTAITAAGGTPSTVPTKPTTPPTPPAPQKETFSIKTSGLPANVTPTIEFNGKPVTETVTALPSEVVPSAFTVTAPGYTAGTPVVDQTNKIVMIPFTEDDVTYTIATSGLGTGATPTIEFNGKPVTTTVTAPESKIVEAAFTITAPTGYKVDKFSIESSKKLVIITFEKDPTTPTT